MSIPIIGLALSVGASLVGAMMQGQMAQYQAEVMNNQLEVDATNERIKAANEENQRQEEYQRAEATNRVAIAVSTGGRNYSYEQGVAPYNKTVMARDLGTIGFNSQMVQDRMAYQIKVNKWNANAESRSAMITGGVEAFSTIGSYMSRPGGLLA
jgi:hypothetical protein